MRRIVHRFSVLEGPIVKGEKALIAALVLLMAAMSFLQLLLRVIFHSGIVWFDPLLRHMVLWAGLTGAALASRYSRHFALEAFVRFAPKRLQAPLLISSDLFTVAISGALLSAAWKFVRDEFASGATAFYIGRTPVPGGWAEMIIPAAFALICFHSFLNIFRPEEAVHAPGTELES